MSNIDISDLAFSLSNIPKVDEVVPSLVDTVKETIVETIPSAIEETISTVIPDSKIDKNNLI